MLHSKGKCGKYRWNQKYLQNTFWFVNMSCPVMAICTLHRGRGICVLCDCVCDTLVKSFRQQWLISFEHTDSHSNTLAQIQFSSVPRSQLCDVSRTTYSRIATHTHTHTQIQFSTVVSVAVTIWYQTHTHKSTEIDLKNATHLEDKKKNTQRMRMFMCTSVYYQLKRDFNNISDHPSTVLWQEDRWVGGKA